MLKSLIFPKMPLLVGIIFFSFITVSLAQIEFTRHDIDDSYQGRFQLADFNGDGSVDIFIQNTWLPYWLENDGNFEFTGHFISENVSSVPSCADFDGDGDVDVIGVYGDNDLHFMENDGSGNFTEILIDVPGTELEFPEASYPGDLDGDGDIDLVVAIEFQVCWIENDGNSPPGFTYHGWIADDAATTYVFDMDNDNDMDILISGWSGNVSWLENNGAGVFGQQTIAMMWGTNIFLHGSPVDVNNDSEMDVVVTLLSGSDYDISWFEKNGNENFTEHILESNMNQAGPLWGTDLDDDGDMDLLGSDAGDNEMVWYENDGDENFTQHLIEVIESPSERFPPIPYDCNEDGYMDFIAKADHDLSWWEQLATIVEIVSITATPTNPPVQIPAAGGSFSWTAEVVNLTDEIQQGHAWTEIVFPAGDTFSPLRISWLVLQPNETLTFEFEQGVPWFAPYGEYTYPAHLGIYPDNVIASDSFTFEKLPGGIGAVNGIQDWEIHLLEGMESELDNDIEISDVLSPVDYSIAEVYPNPFNPTTGITIGLPESNYLQLIVYNMLGQQIAVLADGQISAGYHEFTFDGSFLTNGIYFIKANVTGKMNEIRKVVLMK